MVFIEMLHSYLGELLLAVSSSRVQLLLCSMNLSLFLRPSPGVVLQAVIMPAIKIM